MDTEIAAHRGLDLGAVAHQHSGKRPEQLLALLRRGERVGQESGTLALDDLLKLGDRRGVLARGLGALLGHHHARLLWLVCAAPTLRPWGSRTPSCSKPGGFEGELLVGELLVASDLVRAEAVHGIDPLADARPAGCSAPVFARDD